MAPEEVRPTGTYTAWRWPAAADGFDRFDWELSPLTDPTPDGYFWSHQFWLVGGEAGYAGLQTMGGAPTGKIAIFSIWKARRSRGSDYAGRFAGEGSGFTARVRYSWEIGCRYRMSVERLGDGWWRACVDGTVIGEIQVPPAWGGLRDESIMWTERYQGPLRSCADIRWSRAWFGTPTADGALRPVQRRNYLGDPPGCPGSAVTDTSDGVVHEMGRPPDAAER